MQNIFSLPILIFLFLFTAGKKRGREFGELTGNFVEVARKKAPISNIGSKVLPQQKTIYVNIIDKEKSFELNG